MDRTEREIINFMKAYRDEKDPLKAMGDMLFFMGVSEGPIFWDEARKELEKEGASEQQLKRDYNEHLKRGSKYYMSYEQFKQKKEQGLL